MKKNNKKGISPLIGYILLVSIALFMAVIVYTWLKTYVPAEALECPDTTSLFIKSHSCSGNKLNLTIKNNGNFNVAGYFIRGANVSGQETATLDLSSRLNQDSEGKIFGNSILISGSEPGNSLASGEEAINSFDISGINTLYFVELTPIRYQEVNNKNRTVSCSDAKVTEEITCS